MLNRCEFIGNLGKDPEIRAIQSGDKVANFSLAVTEKWKDKGSGETKERTEWVNCQVWGPLVQVVEKWVHKGDKLFVAGKMQTRKWQDQSGTDRWTTEIRVEQIELLGSPNNGQQQGGNQGGQRQGNQQSGGGQQRGGNQRDLDDEIPF